MVVEYEPHCSENQLASRIQFQPSYSSAEICRHRRWRDEYPFVFPRSVDSGRWEMDPRLECALRHPWDCTCTARTWAGQVKGCTECHTDYCLALAPVPIDGIFVFTVWKNVGPGGEFHDPFHKSHRDLESAWPSSAPPGSHCFAFEQRWLGSELGVYVPYQTATAPDKRWIRHRGTLTSKILDSLR